MRKLGITLALVLVLTLVIAGLVYRQVSYRICWDCSGDEYFSRAIRYACNDSPKYRQTALDFLDQAAQRDQLQALLFLAELYTGKLPPSYHPLHKEQLACLGRDIEPDRNKGISYFQAVIDMLEEQPDGDPDMLGNIGQLYLHSVMPANDPEDQARKWFARAAAEGNYPAMVQLARLADARGDYGEAMKWFRQAANNTQDLQSPLMVGDYYFYGKGVPVDYQKAKTWYRKALEAAKQVAASMDEEEKSRLMAAPRIRLDLVERRLAGQEQGKLVTIPYRLEGTVRNYSIFVEGHPDQPVGTVVNRDGVITARMNEKIEFITPPEEMEKSGFNSMIEGMHWVLSTYAVHNHEDAADLRFAFALKKS